MISCFALQCAETQRITKYCDRKKWTSNLLNNDIICDIKLMEATKLLMFICAAELHDSYVKGKDVPTFVWLMFARDTSSNLPEFLKNHLICVGNSAGVEQVHKHENVILNLN